MPFMMRRGFLATRGVACSVFQRGKIRPRSVVNQSASRRNKADLSGKNTSMLEDRFVEVSQRFDNLGKRFDDADGKLFDSFGKRIDDAINRIASNEQTSMALLGLGVGLIYYTGTKIDKQSADLNTKIDKQSADLNTKIDKQSADLNAKIDKQSADLNAKIDKVSADLIANSNEQSKVLHEMSVSLAELTGKNNQK